MRHDGEYYPNIHFTLGITSRSVPSELARRANPITLGLYLNLTYGNALPSHPELNDLNALPRLRLIGNWPPIFLSDLPWSRRSPITYTWELLLLLST
nr:hypothetical protein Itr_chr07CG14240 [Ipomoea trifida]